MLIPNLKCICLSTSEIVAFKKQMHVIQNLIYLIFTKVGISSTLAIFIFCKGMKITRDKLLIYPKAQNY